MNQVLLRRIRSAKKRAPNVVTLLRLGGKVYGLRWIDGRMCVRLLRRG